MMYLKVEAMRVLPPWAFHPNQPFLKFVQGFFKRITSREDMLSSTHPMPKVAASMTGKTVRSFKGRAH